MKKTFTLIELILVVGIIALLAGAMIPMVSSARQKARAAKVMLLVDTFKTSTQKFFADTGRLPTESSLSSDPWAHELFENSANSSAAWPDPPMGQPIPGWDGPYINGRISESHSPYNSSIGISWSIPAPGTVGRVNLYLYNVPENDALEINNCFDSGIAGDWRSGGRVWYMTVPKIILIEFLATKVN
ncbi:MAG: hypothetical protein JW867_05915 [Candidatus Omnitrophica bacterium]|nr:hypothetical protein [Candidatus Omnitrophota bacterium]